MNAQERITKLYGILDKVELYYRAIGKISFDMECCAPKNGLSQAGEDMAELEKVPFNLLHSDEYIQLIKDLKKDAEDGALEPLQKKLVEYLNEDYDKTANLTEEFNYEMSLAANKSYEVWLEAKERDDYGLFKDAFAKVVELTRREIELRGPVKTTYYDVLLDDYEKGGNERQLDEFFAALKAEILPLVKEIKERGKKIRTDFLTRPCPIPLQEAFSKYLLDLECLDPDSLVLMTTEHPFTTNFGPEDVRVTTHYYEENFVSNIFTTLHEGGHALFMQKEPDEFTKNHVCDRMTSAMHECISRFYENIIGRSPELIHAIYPKMQELCGDIFADVSEQELYEAVNTAEPILNRCDSDELTYCIHILIRYEMEKGFINADMSIDELPAIWNAKYTEYLGVTPTNDREGILQDVHWTSSYGYFPSYALGNAYGAQIVNTMKKEFDVFGCVREGNLQPILDWLETKVFSIASVSTPDEWIRAITGEPLNVQYFIDYLKEKFTSIYEL